MAGPNLTEFRCLIDQLAWGLYHAQAPTQVIRNANLQLIARARAALAEPLSHSDNYAGWQSIATAPRDGRAILVMSDDWPGTPDGRAEECNGHNTYVVEWGGGDEEGLGGEWICYMSMVQDPLCPITPTHWMPLPPPPKAEDKP